MKYIAIPISLLTILTILPTLHAAKTKLHEAATIGDIQALNACIAAGLSLDEQDDEGYTPLHYACQKGHFALVEHMLNKYNPKLNVLAKMQKQTPLDIAISGAITHYLNQTATHLEDAKKYISIVNLLLSKKAYSNSSTPYALELFKSINKEAAQDDEDQHYIIGTNDF